MPKAIQYLSVPEFASYIKWREYLPATQGWAEGSFLYAKHLEICYQVDGIIQNVRLAVVESGPSVN